MLATVVLCHRSMRNGRWINFVLATFGASPRKGLGVADASRKRFRHRLFPVVLDVYDRDRAPIRITGVMRKNRLGIQGPGGRFESEREHQIIVKLIGVASGLPFSVTRRTFPPAFTNLYICSAT